MRLRTRLTTAAIALVCATLGGLTPAALADADETNAALSRLYARYAVTALSQGRPAEAERLAQTALEFSNTNADAHHVTARSMRAEQARTREMITHLERAVELDTFRETDPREARLLLVNTYLRTDEAQRALDLLRSRPAASGDNDDELYAQVRALQALGRDADAEEAAARGRRLYPEDARFFLFQLRRDPLPGPRAGRWLDENRSSGPAYLNALLYYAQEVGNRDRAVELVRRYLSAGGTDPAAAVVLARASAAADDAERLRAAWERFIELGGLSDKTQTEAMYRALPDGSLRGEVTRILERHSGVMLRDEDKSGFWEERYVIEDGRVVRWLVDRNEDGQSEYEIELTDRVPQRVSTTPEGYSVAYGSYPEIASVEVPEGERLRRYRLLPGSLTYRILSPELDWGAPVPGPAFSHELADPPRLLSEELLRDNAYRLERADSGGVVTEVLTLTDGTVIREVVDHDADGRIDHVISYEAGVRVSGMRDADMDGRFEVAEQYANGELALMLVDADGDGTVDYTEELLPDRSYAWDYDGDGVVDAREVVLGRGRVLREFSTDDDGDFELSITGSREVVPNE